MLCGCGTGPTAPEPLPADLASAPTSLALGGRVLTLETGLWRDFQPLAPPDGKPLIALFRVKTDDGSPVPATLRADTVWVIHGGLIWSGVPREERPRAETMPVYEVVAREGPKWGPGVTVDAVVRLRDATGRAFLLRATNQLIQRTD
jgi:hypothetical protein